MPGRGQSHGGCAARGGAGRPAGVTPGSASPGSLATLSGAVATFRTEHVKIRTEDGGTMNIFCCLLSFDQVVQESKNYSKGSRKHEGHIQFCL